MQATDWNFLPFPGGLLDQPEWIMDDLFIIQSEAELIRNPPDNG